MGVKEVRKFGKGKTRENCPVGILFEQAGVQVNYEL